MPSPAICVVSPGDRRGDTDTAAEQLAACIRAAEHDAANCGRALRVSVRPDTGARVNWLAWAVLEALGKDFDLERGRVAADEHWALAEIWLRARAITTLFVIGIERAGVALWRRIANLATTADLDVWLLSATMTLTRGQRELIAASDNPIRRCETDEFLRLIGHEQPAWHRRYALQQERLNRLVFPTVPTDEIPFYRDTCRRVLSAEDFAIADRSYRRAFSLVAQWLRAREDEPLREEQVGEVLADLVRDARGVHEQLALLRGAQVAFWRARWLLKVRPDALVSAYRQEPRGIDDVDAAARLNSYVAPRTAALGAVALSTQLSPGRLSLLNADQITRDCGAINIGDENPINLGRKRSLILAHRLDSQRRCHDPEGPLFCTHDERRLRPQTVQQLLRRTAMETGLPLTQTWSPPLDQHHAFWMHRRGLTLQPLAQHAP